MDGVNVLRMKSLTRIYGAPIVPELPINLAMIDADILHGNFPNPYSASMVAFASLWRRIPAVLTWHNDLPPVTRAASVLVNLHDSLVLPGYMVGYRRIIATTEVYAQSSPILRKYRHKVVVIPNGVDCARFSPKKNGQKIRERFGIGSSKLVLFVGALTRWHRYKGLDVLIKAFRPVMLQCKDARLLVVGDGELRQFYQKLARRLDFYNEILFVGDVPDEELPQFYAASDVCVLPSLDRSEGFGLTLLEANASGKPVVASNVGGVASLIRDQVNGLLVPAGDHAKLSQALLRLLLNDRLRESMAENARMSAESYDWRIVLKKTLEVYEQAMNA